MRKATSTLRSPSKLLSGMKRDIRAVRRAGVISCILRNLQKGRGSGRVTAITDGTACFRAHRLELGDSSAGIHGRS